MHCMNKKGVKRNKNNFKLFYEKNELKSQKIRKSQVVFTCVL